MIRSQLVAFAASLLAAFAAAQAPAQEAGPAVLPPPSWDGPQLVAPADAPPGDVQSAYSAIESLITPPADAPVGEALPPGKIEAAAAETVALTPMWYESAYWLGTHPWDMGLELGINGSEGTNNVFSMRIGGHVKRVTPKWKFDSSLAYNKNNSNGVETQNNGKHDLRLDRILAESPWTLFVLENLIYDEFQAWDVQLSLNTGVGYQIFKTPLLDLLGRVGAGATREFGGAENDWQPTALLGVDYNHQLTKTQKLTAKVDYFPEWEDFRQYRVVSDLGWQVDLDRPKNVSLKFSLIDRYDSTPDGVDPNSLDYAVLMIWKL